MTLLWHWRSKKQHCSKLLFSLDSSTTGSSQLAPMTRLLHSTTPEISKPKYERYVVTQTGWKTLSTASATVFSSHQGSTDQFSPGTWIRTPKRISRTRKFSIRQVTFNFEDLFKFQQLFLIYLGLMRCRLSPDASKLVICTTGGYLIIVHDLDLSTLARDLAGFRVSR